MQIGDGHSQLGNCNVICIMTRLISSSPTQEHKVCSKFKRSTEFCNSHYLLSSTQMSYCGNNRSFSQSLQSQEKKWRDFSVPSLRNAYTLWMTETVYFLSPPPIILMVKKHSVVKIYKKMDLELIETHMIRPCLCVTSPPSPGCLSNVYTAHSILQKDDPWGKCSALKSTNGWLLLWGPWDAATILRL